MPVTVSGNPASSTFIILLPGGPAGDGQVYRRVFPVFRKALEPRYRLVYYDQRGAGNCQGRYDTATLNLRQLSDDLNRIVSVLQASYERPKIFLLGYSYGGAVGMTYLLNSDYRPNVAGFIGLAGAFDRRYQAEYRERLVAYWLRDWVKEGYIDSYESLTEGYRCADRQDPDQCRRDSVRVKERVDARLAEVATYNQFKLTPAAIGRLLGVVFFSPTNPLLSGSNENQNARYFQPEFDNLLLSDRVGAITTPILLLNGRYDTNVPVFDAQRIFGQIGTPAAVKSLVVLPESGHLPMLTEPEELARQIIGFVERQ